MANLRDVIAPNNEQRQKRLEAFKQYAFYGVVCAILILVIFVVPILAGGITAKGWSYYLPKSVPGWIVFWAIRGGTVAGNMCVFGLLKAQAKINCKDNENYKKANELLAKQNGKEGFIPRSPKAKETKDWLTKGILVFVTTALESIVIGVLALNWDLMTFISCITSSITAILFGIVTMLKDEVYWTEEYLLYAQYVVDKEQASIEEQSIEEPKEEKENEEDA